MSDAYIEKQYHEVSSLYRLDQIKPTANAGDEAEMEYETEKQRNAGWSDLPGASRGLLIALPCIWLAIIDFSVYQGKKSKRKN